MELLKKIVIDFLLENDFPIVYSSLDTSILWLRRHPQFGIIVGKNTVKIWGNKNNTKLYASNTKLYAHDPKFFAKLFEQIVGGYDESHSQKLRTLPQGP